MLQSTASVIPDFVSQETPINTKHVLGAIEIEKRYRLPSASRHHVLGIFIRFVVSMRIHSTEFNNAFAARKH